MVQIESNNNNGFGDFFNTHQFISQSRRNEHTGTVVSFLPKILQMKPLLTEIDTRQCVSQFHLSVRHDNKHQRPQLTFIIDDSSEFDIFPFFQVSSISLPSDGCLVGYHARVAPNQTNMYQHSDL